MSKERLSDVTKTTTNAFTRYSVSTPGNYTTNKMLAYRHHFVRCISVSEGIAVNHKISITIHLTINALCYQVSRLSAILICSRKPYA
jgi:hypothetical protein